ncbi:MAG: SDR family oxidoreductase [Pseudomonadota bacterium]
MSTAIDPLLDFTGQTALVTGGSRGLGREMALALAARGADVVIASRKTEACDAVAAEVRELGRRALAAPCHVGDWDALGTLAEQAIGEFGRIDVLINNAGMSPLYPALTDVTEALFDKVIDVNLKGPFRLSTLLGEHMQRSGGGSILNISSIAATRASPNSEPYGAAKAGINALTRSLASAYAPQVRVNSIIVGPFLTDIAKAWDMEAFEANASQTMAIPRGGEPAEIVGAALYLVSRASSFTTAATLRVDGGSR